MARKFLIVLVFSFLVSICLVSTAYSDDLTHTKEKNNVQKEVS